MHKVQPALPAHRVCRVLPAQLAIRDLPDKKEVTVRLAIQDRKVHRVLPDPREAMV